MIQSIGALEHLLHIHDLKLEGKIRRELERIFEDLIGASFDTTNLAISSTTVRTLFCVTTKESCCDMPPGIEVRPGSNGKIRRSFCAHLTSANEFLKREFNED